MTPAGIEPATFRFVAQRLNHVVRTLLKLFKRAVILVICFCCAIKTLCVYLTYKFKWNVWVHGFGVQKTGLVYDD